MTRWDLLMYDMNGNMTLDTQVEGYAIVVLTEALDRLQYRGGGVAELRERGMPDDPKEYRLELTAV